MSKSRKTVKLTPESGSPLRLITPIEAAERLGIDQLAADPKRVVLRLARLGQLRGRRVGVYVMIDPLSVDAFIRRGTI